MDWNVIAQYLPLYKKAAWLTLRLGLAGIVIAIVVGLVCALVQSVSYTHLTLPTKA